MNKLISNISVGGLLRQGFQRFSSFGRRIFGSGGSGGSGGQFFG